MIASPMTRPLENPAYDVRPKEERQREDADRAGDPVQRLHLDNQAEPGDREQQ